MKGKAMKSAMANPECRRQTGRWAGVSCPDMPIREKAAGFRAKPERSGPVAQRQLSKIQASCKVALQMLNSEACKEVKHIAGIRVQELGMPDGR